MQQLSDVREDIDGKLTRVIRELDAAIERAVENPLTFASERLDGITAACLEAEALNATEAARERAGFEERAALIWQMRARAGRLQMLMDSATEFYSHCFSAGPPEGLAYGVQGEWSEMTYSSHLVFDC